MEKKLIDAVRNRPAIYDLKHPGNKNLELRNKLWEEIAEIVGKPVTRCRQRWKTLRETARKELARNQASGSALGGSSPWPYSEQLSFLKDSFRVKTPETEIKKELIECTFGEEASADPFYDDDTVSGEISVQFSNQSSYEEEVVNREAPPSLSLSGVVSTPSPTNYPHTPPTRKRQKPNGEETCKAFEKFLNEINHNCVERQTEYPIMMFFKALAMRCENKYTDAEELEIEQAVLEAFIKKTNEIKTRHDSRN